MKNNLKIDKEDLWNKINVDQRMPKKQFSVKKYFISSPLIVFLFVVLGFTLRMLKYDFEFEKNSSLVNNVNNDALYIDNKDEAMTSIINSNDKLKLDKNAKDENDEQAFFERNINEEQTSSDITLLKNYMVDKLNSGTITFNNKLGKKSSFEKDEKYNSNHFPHALKNSHTDGLKTISDSETYEQIDRPNKIKDIERNTSPHLIATTTTTTTTTTTHEQYSDLDSKNIINKIENLSLLPLKLFYLKPIEFDFETNEVLLSSYIENKNTEVFCSLSYGLGFMKSVDSFGEDIGNASPFDPILNAYQLELGLLRKFDSWNGRVGLGADILRGHGVWNSIDTTYTVIDELSTFERYKITTSDIVHQQYGNVYLTAGIQYLFKINSLVVSPRLGIKYNILDLTSGNLLVDGSLEKQEISNLGKRQRINYSFGLDVEKVLTRNCSLVFGAKYETKINYRLTPNLNQSISLLYISIGGQFHF